MGKMEIVTGSTGAPHVTPIDDAVRNTNCGHYDDMMVFNVLDKFSAQAVTANQVKIQSGYGMMHGRYFKIAQNDHVDCVIPNIQSSGAKRMDLICARYAIDGGIESITPIVINGAEGNTYTEPTYYSDKNSQGEKIKNINENAQIIDFPLYKVYIDGHVIDHLEACFTPLPDGGRLGEIENAFQNVLTEFGNVQEVVNNLPQDISQAASKSYVDTKVGELGNGKAALFHNYSADANYGSEKSKFAGTSSKYGHVMLSDKSDFSNSTPKSATDAVAVTEKALNDAISTLKESFTVGCNEIATALINKGVTPTKGENTENYTPNDFITAIDALLAKRKRTVSWSVTTSKTSNGYTQKVTIGGVTKTFTDNFTTDIHTWTQNV